MTLLNDDTNKSLLSQEDKDKAIIIENTFVVKNKKKFPVKGVLIASGVATLITGSIVGYSIYKEERNQKIAREVNNYIEQQKALTENAVSNSEAFIERLSLKLSTQDQFHPVLTGEVSIYNEIEYVENVKSFELFGKDIEWFKEEVDIYGYAKAFFEYGINIKKLKAVAVSDNEVDLFIQAPFFREESAHRIAGTYSPDPEKANKTSGDAKRKTQIEVNYGKLADSSNNIQQRAMVAWEDKFDQNIKSSIYKIHKEDKTLDNLNKVAEDNIKDLIETLNINPDNIKINVKVDETIK